MLQEAKKVKNRPSKAEFAKRLLTIQGWMIDGNPSSLIVQQVLLKEWVKSERHAYILLEKARKEWIKYEDDNLDEKRKLKIQEFKNRIRGIRAAGQGSIQSERLILLYEKEIIKLEGIAFMTVKQFPNHGKKETDVVIPVKASVEHLTSEEIEKLLNQVPDAYA